MKIIRLTTLLDFGGQERQYISFAEADSESLKNEYIFAAIGHGGFAEQIIREKGFEVIIFNNNPKISNLKNIWVLYKWFKKTKPDVIHTAAAEANFHGVIAAKLAGIKTIIGEEIGFPKHSSAAKLIFRIIYKFTYKVVCVSNAVKNFLVTTKEISPSKGIVIYNPVSPAIATAKQLSSNFTIVSVGRFEKVKNQTLLIQAFSKIENTETRLILVGEGSERKNLEELIKTLNLQDRVTLVGFVKNPEKYIAKSHLFVLPSLSEGFGIAVVEAMQQETACLCSNVGGISEYITHNKTGWLFNPNDETELVEQLNKVIATPYIEIQKIAKQAKMSVENSFTIQKYVENLENLYLKNHD
jgi:glycosyltransferase involved in cell wall biosynthesis